MRIGVLRRTAGRACAGVILVLLASIAARASDVTVEKDVAYGTGGSAQRLDIFKPDGFTGVRPAVVLVHGGGWIEGDKGDFAWLGRQLARVGYVAFSVNYHLAPVYRYPMQIDDVQRAVRWVRAHAADYNVDPQRLGAVGESAGGHLVAMLGTRRTRDNSDASLAQYDSRVECVVDMYGPTDFTPENHSMADGIQLLLLKNFFGKGREEAPDLYREGSPIVYVSADSAPFLIMHGTKDPLVPFDQSQRLYDALRKAKVEATLVPMANEGHGFDMPENRKRSLALTLEFLAKYLHP